MATTARSRKPSPCWMALAESYQRLPDQNLNVGQRVALTVEYDGAGFSGWQAQRDVITVQQTLESALSSVADRPVRVHCAGRTDTGVHATNQVVHFDDPVGRSPKSWLMGTNANLPRTVAVRDARPVSAEFHARFSARSRRYRYLVYNSPTRPAIAAEHVTWVRQPLDEALMDTAAQALIGERDFSAFRAASCQSSTPMRRVDFVRVYRRGVLVCVDIQANAFLHHMVRNIVGTLIVVGRGLQPPAWAGQLLDGGDRTVAADTAAPNGLYLVAVEYPPDAGLASLPLGPVFLPPDQ